MNYLDYITLSTLQYLQHIVAEGPERPRVLKNEKEIIREIFKFKKEEHQVICLFECFNFKAELTFEYFK